MATSQKPRKAHRARPVHIHSAHNAISRQHTMDDDQITDIGIAYWTALDIHLRAPDEQQWAVLASAMNIAIILAERGHGTEFIPTIKTALEGLQRSKDRAATGKSWALDAGAIASIREALTVHDAQCASAKMIEMRNALREVHRRIERGIAYGVAA